MRRHAVVTASAPIIFLLAAFLKPVAAQTTQYYIDETGAIPIVAGNSYSVDLGDVNGDGRPDILIGSYNQQSRLFINRGGGAFGDETFVRLPRASYPTFSVKFADFEGDGDLDIAVGNRGAQSRIWINNGTGVFADETTTRAPTGVYDTIRIAVGDVTGDGRPEVVFANYNFPAGQQDRLWINDGSGAFSDGTSARLPAVIDIGNGATIADVNRDGWNDIIITNVGGQLNRLYMNRGSSNPGFFSDVTSTNMPLNTSNHTTNVAAGDVDSDGDLDLIMSNGGSTAAQLNRLLINNGSGVFADETTTRLPATLTWAVDVDFSDVNGDGCLDIVEANYNSQNRLYLNGRSGANCTGVFTDVTSTSLPVDNVFTRESAAGDLDADGDADIYFANVNANNQALANDGTGKFASFTLGTLGRLPIDTDNTTHGELVDVDKDGDLDAVLSNRNQQSRIYINNGLGYFTDQTATRAPAAVYDTIRIAVGDVDLDGDPDVYLANLGTGSGQQNRLWINNGTGQFTDQTSTRLPPVTDLSNDAAIADLNNDTFPDIVVANVNGQANRVYLNNGSGVFTEAVNALPPNTGNSSVAVEIAEVSGDGWPDILVGNGGGAGNQQNRLYINNQNNTFTDQTATRLPAFADATIDVKAGDVNNDNCPDILVANYSNQQNRLYLGGKSGTVCTGVFTDATATNLPVAAYYSRDVDLADVDKDGWLDIIVANLNSQQNRLWINDGTGKFTDQTAARLPADTNNTWDAAFGDVDGDTDLDLLMSNYAQQNRLYINILITATQLPPVAAAGPDQTVVESSPGAGASVTLDGSGSSDPDGNINAALFEWFEGTTLLGTGQTLGHTFPVGVHVVTLRVTDSQGLVATDTVTITVNAGAQPPVVNAGPDQTVPEGTQVTLDGSGTTDPDGNIALATFRWYEGTTLLGTGTTLPVTLPVGTHTITLQVTDAQGLVGTDTVIITVLAGQPPVANAGPDQTVTEPTPGAGAGVTLNGSASYDPDGNIGAATFAWYEGATLLGTGTTLPVTLPVGVHSITLVVTDTQGLTGTDTVLITVNGLTPPAANAGPDQTVIGGTSVTLNGSASFDADGVIVTYEWYEDYGQIGQTLLGLGVSISQTFPVGTHTVTLVVTDNDGLSSTDSLTVQVNPASIPATIRITPRCLNVTSRGKYINAMVTLPAPYNVANIDPLFVILCVKCDGTDNVPAVSPTTFGGAFHTKFSRSLVEAISPEGRVTYMVKGFLTDGTAWSGTDTIVVFKSSEKHAKSGEHDDDELHSCEHHDDD